MRNRSDIEQYRQILVPRYADDEVGESTDVHQKVREDFYEALTAFGMCLRTALATRSFFEDGAFSDAQIATYKRDLKFFSNLRRMAKRDAHETVDFSAYEDQIRKLVDRYVIGQDVVSTATCWSSTTWRNSPRRRSGARKRLATRPTSFAQG